MTELTLENILVVDDEPSILQVCRRILESLGYVVDTANDVDQALEIFKAKKYELVLTDLTMPGHRNGADLLQEIKRDSPQTDVVIMTAFPTLETAIPTLKSGAYDYLMKPFDQEFLCSVVRRCFEKRRLSTQLKQEKIWRQEIQQAYNQLHEVQKLKEAFLARVNHEIRIPLTPALLTLDLLEPYIKDPQAVSLFGTLREKLAQLKALHENLLLFNEIRNAGLKISCQPCSLRQLLHHVVYVLRPEWEKRNMQVDVTFQDGVESVWGRETLLQRAFIHLLQNAIRFNKPGGQVKINVFKDPQGVHVSFADNGIGIPSEKLSDIFDSFYQVAWYLTREVEGLGLGLAIVRRIAELHGGSIQVNSQEGIGSTFDMILPVPISPSGHSEGVKATEESRCEILTTKQDSSLRSE